MRRKTFALGTMLLCVGLIGCDQGRQAPAKTTVQVVHAAPGFDDLAFLREQRSEATLAYKGSTTMSFDEDRYDFSVDTFPADSATSIRVRTFPANVLAGTRYTFVLAEVAGGIEPVTLEAPEIEAGATTAQVQAVHAAATVPAVQMFLEPAGADLTTATPLGSLSFLQSTAPTTRQPGDYEVTLTEVGNPANVLLASNAIALSAATVHTLVVVDGAGEGTAPLSVVVVSDAPTVLIDKNTQAGMRVLNAAADRAARDVAVGGQFTPPQYAAIEFGAVSSYATVPAGNSTVNVTPAGNPGVIEVEQTVAANAGRLYTLLLSGQPGQLSATAFLDDRRRIGDRARLSLLNAADQFTQLGFYVVAPGTDVTTVFPTSVLEPNGGTQSLELAPATYEVVLRDATTQAVVAGPQTVTLTAGGLFGVLAVNGADAATAEIVLFDDF